MTAMTVISSSTEERPRTSCIRTSSAGMRRGKKKRNNARHVLDTTPGQLCVFHSFGATGQIMAFTVSTTDTLCRRRSSNGTFWYRTGGESKKGKKVGTPKETAGGVPQACHSQLKFLSCNWGLTWASCACMRGGTPPPSPARATREVTTCSARAAGERKG
jgi:hypothetical protein